MSDENTENTDSTTGAEESETSEETTDGAEASEGKDEALLKAESKIVELKKELKGAKKPKETAKETTTEEKPETSDKSNEPDYGKITFLAQKGVEHPDDIKIVQDEADRLKLPLTDILGMEHIKSQLETNKDGRNAQEGMPKGKGSKGATSQQDVDYWVAKEGLPKDQDLAAKVVNARMSKDGSQKMFSDELFSEQVE